MKLENRKTKPKSIIFYISIFCLVLLTFFYIVIPEIKLKGDSTVIIDVNSKYKDEFVEVKSIYNNITKDIKVDTNINVNKIGTYYINYLYSNNFFNYKITRKVIVKDKRPPQIILEGGKTAYYCKNSDYKEEGYKAFDNVDGNITDKVKVIKKKDKIIYEVSDKANNKTRVIRNLKQEDKTSPTITLNGNQTVIIPLNGEYIEEGAEVLDNCDLDLNKNLKITNDIDNTKVGTYKVKYQVTDESNNKKEAYRTVKVLEEAKANTIYLTFDDGPRAGTTNKILDVLKSRNVKATFFVTNNGPDELIKRIVSEGHSIGIHTATHNYAYIYASIDNYFDDLEIVRNRINTLTGVNTNLIRFPGGSSNTISKKYKEGIMSELVKETVSRGYQYYDWNIDSNDSYSSKDKEKIYNNVINNLHHERANIILMHDVKIATSEVIDKIIDYGLSNGYNFEPLTSSTMLVKQKVNN